MSVNRERRRASGRVARAAAEDARPLTAARSCNDGHYGNAILSRHPFAVMSEGRLRRRRDEERAVQWLKVSIVGST